MSKNRVRQFCLLPLRAQLQNDYERIQSIAECKGQLVVALDQNRIFFFEFSSDQGGNYNVKYVEGKKAAIANHEIYKMVGVDDQLLLLYRKGKNEPGVLFAMSIDEKKPEQISKNVVDFSGFSTNTAAENKKFMIAAIVDTSVLLWELKLTEDVDRIKKVWNKMPGQISIGQKCLSVALFWPTVFVQCQNCYVISQMSDGDQQAMPASFEAKNADDAYSYALSKNKFFVYSDKKIQYLDFNNELKFLKDNIEFTETQLEHARCEKIGVSISQNTASLYELEKSSHFISIGCPGLSHTCSLQGRYLILSNEKQLFLVYNCSSIYQAVIAGKVENLIKSYKDLNTDILAATFSRLWQNEYKSDALSMLKIKELHPALLDIVNLFSIIRTDGLSSDMPYLNIPTKTEDPKLSKELIEELIAIRGENPNEFTRQIADTALFEIYAHQEDIPRLSSFIDEIPTLENKSIRAFFKDNPNTAPYAMYLTFIGNINEAMEVFRNLPKYDQVILDEITKQLIRNGNNWEFTSTNVEWLMKISPIYGCKVLTSENVQLKEALPFCNTKFPQYYLIVLKGFLDHKDIVNRSDLANTYVKSICDILILMNEPSTFTRDKVQFCKCVIANHDAPLDEIKEELEGYIIDILRQFQSSIDTKDLELKINQISSKRVKVEFFRASGNVLEALNLLWDDSKEDNLSTLEQFCKESKIPTNAFMILIDIMKDKLPTEKKMEVLMDLLSRNMSVIDVSSALETLAEIEKLEDVASFLESSYRRLVTMRKDAELDAAFAESNEFESEYQKVRLESQSIALTSQKICPRCKQPIGYQYVLRAPNGELYHWKCIQGNRS